MCVVCVWCVYMIEIIIMKTGNDHTHPHVIRTMVEGIPKTLDSWWSLSYYPPVKGRKISYHPGGGILGEGGRGGMGVESDRREETCEE